MEPKLGFICAIFAIITVIQHVNGCNLTTVESCIDVFQAPHGGETAILKSSKIDQVCSDFITLKDCAESSRENCTDASLLEYNTLADTLEFACTVDSIQVIKDNTECLEEGDEGNEACIQTYRSGVADDPASLCQLTDTYLQCGVKAYEAACGRDVASWAAQTLDAAVTAVERYRDCDLDAMGHLSSAPILSSLGVVALVAILVLGQLAME